MLYASAVIIPQFAQQVLGYTATWSGLILSPGGVVVVMLIPIVGRLMSVHADALLIAFGFFVMGCALLLFERARRPASTFGRWCMMRTLQIGRRWPSCSCRSAPSPI